MQLKKHEDEAEHKRLIAYVVSRKEQTASLEQSLLTERVTQWSEVFDEAYHENGMLEDATFNVVSWNDSYTGQPIPSEEMHEWVDQTVERILSLQPRQVLEIGCGTGLLLFRIAPHCTTYWGTDISQQALNYIRQADPHLSQQVTLLHQSAADLKNMPADHFDVVVLNSVVQYFPNISYLLDVIQQITELFTTSNGYLFLGDVRSLPLLNTFHTSVELTRAPAAQSIQQFHQHILKRVQQEEELVIDPAFFFALKKHFPQISDVTVQLKRGRTHNELTRFRYDVVLRIGSCLPAPVAPSWQDWQAEQLTIERLGQLLRQAKPAALAIAHIPNARLQQYVTATTLLEHMDPAKTVADLHTLLQETYIGNGIDPEEFWTLGNKLAYAVTIGWADTREPGNYTVVLQRKEQAPQEAIDTSIGDPVAQQGDMLLPWHGYANSPLQHPLQKKFLQELRTYLRDTLPDYEADNRK